jgi:hypothetical protein
MKKPSRYEVITIMAILFCGLIGWSFQPSCVNKTDPWKFIGMNPGTLRNNFTGNDTGEIAYGPVSENINTGARKRGYGYIQYPFQDEQKIMDMGFTLEQVRGADGKHFMRLNK